jgi:hypothetical protein
MAQIVTEKLAKRPIAVKVFVNLDLDPGNMIGLCFGETMLPLLQYAGDVAVSYCK